MVRKLIGADTCECLGYLCTGLEFRKGGAGSARSGSQGQDDYCYCPRFRMLTECMYPVRALIERVELIFRWQLLHKRGMCQRVWNTGPIIIKTRRLLRMRSTASFE